MKDSETMTSALSEGQSRCPGSEGVAGLIARLVKATGPDPFLDELLEAERYGWAVLEIGKDKHTKFVRLRDAEGKEFMHRQFIDGSYAADKYTSSIDAALTLVPEGMYFLLGAGKLLRKYLAAASVSHCPTDRPYLAQAEGRTPALALCIAALKARAAISEPGHR